MKKRSLAILIVVAMAVGCVFALTACGDDISALDGKYDFYLTSETNGEIDILALREDLSAEIKDGKIYQMGQSNEIKKEGDGFSFTHAIMGTVTFIKIADGEYYCAELNNYMCLHGKTPYPLCVFDGKYDRYAVNMVNDEIESLTLAKGESSATIKNGILFLSGYAREIKKEGDGFSVTIKNVATWVFVKIADGEYYHIMSDEYLCLQGKTPFYPVKMDFDDDTPADDDTSALDGEYDFYLTSETNGEIEYLTQRKDFIAEIKDGKLYQLGQGVVIKKEGDGFSFNHVIMGKVTFVKIADGEYYCAELHNYMCLQGKTPSYTVRNVK